MAQPAAIKVFCRVMETGGFTKAANALDMPKATVSKLVGDLELHLRIKLLRRTTRSVQVTPDGARYYERVSRWLRELDDSLYRPRPAVRIGVMRFRFWLRPDISLLVDAMPA